MKNKNLLLSLVVAGLIALGVLISFLSNTAAVDTETAVKELGCNLLYAILVSVAAIPLCGITFVTLIFLDRPAVMTRIQLFSNQLSARIRYKNSAQILPCLQSFLYGILSRNSDFLHLPLGKDAGCLTPRGFSASYRNNCVFYHFDLIAADSPEMDLETLRKILQDYINKELYNYGIAGLAATYISATEGKYFSLYLDRVSYNAAQHCLSFDVLYVCTEEAVRYVQNAAQREAAPAQPEVEIFDDEVQ